MRGLLRRVSRLLRRKPAGTGDLFVTDQMIVGFRYWSATIDADHPDAPQALRLHVTGSDLFAVLDQILAHAKRLGIGVDPTRTYHGLEGLDTDHLVPADWDTIHDSIRTYYTRT